MESVQFFLQDKIIIAGKYFCWKMYELSELLNRLSVFNNDYFSNPISTDHFSSKRLDQLKIQSTEILSKKRGSI